MVMSVGVLPLTITISELPDQTYTVTDAFLFEVALTNNSPTPLTIPRVEEA